MKRFFIVTFVIVYCAFVQASNHNDEKKPNTTECSFAQLEKKKNNLDLCDGIESSSSENLSRNLYRSYYLEELYKNMLQETVPNKDRIDSIKQKLDLIKAQVRKSVN